MDAEQGAIFMYKLRSSIADLELGHGTFWALKKAGIHTVGELLKYGEEELICVPGIIPKNVYQINEKLKKFGLALLMDLGQVAHLFKKQHSFTPPIIEDEQLKPGSMIERLADSLTNDERRTLFKYLCDKYFLVRSEDQKKLSFPASLDLQDTGLLVRTINALHENNISSLDQLADYTRAQVLDFKRFGKASVDDVENILEKHGLKLKDQD